MRLVFTLVLVLLSLVPVAGQETLQAIADKAVQENHTPGLVLGIFDGEDLQLAAAGKRKIGADVAITPDDQMHLGSCTKAFTAVLVARLVEQKKLSWDSTIAKVLPEVIEEIHEDFHAVTIEQLLNHTSGVLPDAQEWWLDEGDNVTERRMNILKQNLASEPQAEPGAEYVYSNLGYMIAGLMAGKVSETTWEEAMQVEVLEPLEITTAGFGVPGTDGEIDQPWGHELDEEGNRVAVQADNADALGPAGTLYMSVADWCKFAEVFISYPDDFLEVETIVRLVTPSDVSDYALGWGVYDRRWAKGVAYSHAGSNTLWYANIWIAPEINKIFLVTMNSASDEAADQADTLIGDLRDLNIGK
jgi:CubicO group peptidase (beta-lactamase class C family)